MAPLILRRMILEVGSADELHRAWDAVETSLGIYRAAMAAPATQAMPAMPGQAQP